MELSSLFLLNGLTEEEVNTCRRLSNTEEHCYSKGTVIYDSQHAQPALAMVLEGHARVMHGRVVMNDLYSGDVFGAAALFGSGETYLTTVTAVTDCRLWLIPQQTVSHWMAEVPQVGENYVRFLSDRIRFLNRRLSTLTAGPSDDKLWSYLLAKRDSNGIVTLSGGMSELAVRLDMGRSSLYRSLDALVEIGRIRREGKKIYILKMEE